MWLSPKITFVVVVWGFVYLFLFFNTPTKERTTGLGLNESFPVNRERGQVPG